jgi:hypothetical protein
MADLIGERDREPSFRFLTSSRYRPGSDVPKNPSKMVAIADRTDLAYYPALLAESSIV